MIGGDDFEAAVLGVRPPAAGSAAIARANRQAGQARRRRDEVAGATSRLRAEVPFVRHGQEDGPLSRDSALDWLHSGFGRNCTSLMDHQACSRSALCSVQSTTRAQLVVADCDAELGVGERSDCGHAGSGG